MKLAVLVLAVLGCLTTTFGQVALVAHGYAQSTLGGAAATTAAIDTSACIHNCAEIIIWSSNGQTGTPSDSLGNIWIMAPCSVRSGPYYEVSIWVALSPTVGASQTFSTGSGYYSSSIAVMAFNYVASGPDKCASANETNYATTGSFSPGSMTPTNADELVVTGVGTNSAANMTISSPLTLADTAPSTSLAATIGSAYEIQTTATAVSPTWNWTASAGPITTAAATFYSTLAPAPLTVSTASLPEGFNGTPYTEQLVESGGVGPFTWTQTAGTLPTGLSLSSGGLTSGTPTQTISATPETFQVEDSNSSTASSGSLPLTIASTALSITSTSCPSGTQYAAYAGCTFSAVGGTSPYTWSWSNSDLYAGIPDGLTVNSSTGVVSSSLIGAQGAYNVNVTVTDSLGSQATHLISFSFQGINAWMTGIFPSDAIWYHRMDAATTGLPVDNSPATGGVFPTAYQGDTIRPFFGNTTDGLGNTPNGIPAIEVPYNQSTVAVSTNLYQCYYGTKSNGSCYAGSPSQAPIPSYAPIEASCTNSNPVAYINDGHVLVYLEAGGGNKPALYEMWQGQQQNGLCGAGSGGGWLDGSNALWPDTTSENLTPQGGGTSDAAGLPILPLLITADEVIGTGTPSVPNGTVAHIMRITIPHMLSYWVWPGTQTAGIGSCTGLSTGQLISQSSPPSSCTAQGPAGEIFRLKAATVTPSCASTSPQAAIIITALRDYGVILADNGLGIGLIGTPDSRWNSTDLACLSQLHGSDFEPVNVSSLMVSTASMQTQGGSGSVANPTFLPAAGTYTGTQSVVISTATGGATICWKVGSAPTTNGAGSCTSGTTYSAPVSVATSETIYSIGTLSGDTDSSTVSAAYTINAGSPGASILSGFKCTGCVIH